MKKQIIRLTEGDLHRIIENSVKKILKEVGETPPWQNKLGGTYARQIERGDHEGAHNTYHYAMNKALDTDTDEKYNKLSSSFHKGMSDYMNNHNNDEEYNPWLSGTASYINGKYDIPYGFHVEIDCRHSTVSIEDPNGDEENSYFLQGDEADNLIVDICKYWEENDTTSQEEAVNAVISGLF